MARGGGLLAGVRVPGQQAFRPADVVTADQARPVRQFLSLGKAVRFTDEQAWERRS